MGITELLRVRSDLGTFGLAREELLEIAFQAIQFAIHVVDE